MYEYVLCVYIVQVLQIWLTNRMNRTFFCSFSHAILMRLCLSFSSYIYLQLMNVVFIPVCQFFSPYIFCSQRFTCICLCNGHLINDTRWWNVQYNYSIMCDFCAVLVKSWTLNSHNAHVFWCNALTSAHIHWVRHTCTLTYVCLYCVKSFT